MCLLTEQRDDAFGGWHDPTGTSLLWVDMQVAASRLPFWLKLAWLACGRGENHRVSDRVSTRPRATDVDSE